MEEIYQAIEEKIKASKAYPFEVNGMEIYDEICDQIDDKDNGHYICMVKKEGEYHFEYHIEIMDNEFNLAGITIVNGDEKTYIDFDH
jgi:hypothetical protein